MAKQLSCGVEVLRGLFLILNITFVLVGIALIGIGTYIEINDTFSAILTKLKDAGNFESQLLGFLAFVLIGGGVFTILIALLGCMGSLWHNRHLLYIYGVILSILMILELAGFIMTFVYKNKLEDVYRKNLLTVFNTALNNSDTRILNIFADLEKSMQCCGVNGIDDYHGKEPINPDCYRYSRRGCSTAIIELLNKNLPIIYVTLGIVLLFELFGLIGAITLAIALKNSPDTIYSSKPGDVLQAIVPGRRSKYDQF